jgi:hypothetical protein
MILQLLGYVALEALPEKLRSIDIEDVARSHSGNLEVELELLYKRAIEGSHL